jgi:V8-like Glu-specific endopeptidase
MRNPKLITLALFTLGMTSGCGPLEEPRADSSLESQSEAIVYGTDGRQDVYAHPDAQLRARAQQSTVALMLASSINTTNPDNVTFSYQSLGSAYNLCTTERFRSDPTAAYCSGTLVDDDLVLTAGHCITTSGECADTRFVFNYYRPTSSTLQTVTTADIFSCKSVVIRQRSVVNGLNMDFALIRLDRPATPRFTPAPVRTSTAALSSGQNVAVIGSGSGIPFKLDSSGSVRDGRASALDYFVATTDTFGGNSGSAVYETSGYSVAGILVRGGTDYVANGSCNVVNVCAETACGGEDSTYVYRALRAFCNVATSTRLCGALPPINTFSFNVTNTNGALQNTVNRSLTLKAGNLLEVGTCGVPGATGSGDTFLRLYGPGGAQVASNDNGCGASRTSFIRYSVPVDGTYEIRAGCYASTSCSGTVAFVTL